MVLVLSLVYVGFGAAIGALIWRQERRKDRRAQILGLTAAGHDAIGILGLVLISAILAIVPTVIAWAVLRPLVR
jgi:Tfp pilus assembly protein PilN